MKAILIGGVTSGVGKTTIATGIMSALSRRRLRVQPFKTGPDYIDTTYHTWVTGFPSRNLDTWMLPRDTVLELFHKAMVGKDVAVIEGVMGLFDGHNATDDEASTAELAKLLNVPVILVVDSRNGARSLAAVVKGYLSFDSGLGISGVILNGIGSPSHYEICRQAIEHYTGVVVLGYLPRRRDLELPERHLGLIPTVEGPASEEFRQRLTDQCESTLDLDGILGLAERASPPFVAARLFPPEPCSPVVRIAVARDRAFSFYYQDSLDLLEACGAELAPFSPLQDAALPPGVGGIYIGGGFPEMYAGELEANESMRRSLRGAAGGGIPVYAECGGLMYLGSAIRDLEGKTHAMAGVIPITSRIDKPRLNLGYRTVRALSDGPLLKQGESARGHEFHWSNIDVAGDLPPAYSLAGTEPRNEGFQSQNVLASYVHLHMGSQPSMARRFVEVCRRFRGNAPV